MIEIKQDKKRIEDCGGYFWGNNEISPEITEALHIILTEAEEALNDIGLSSTEILQDVRNAVEENYRKNCEIANRPPYCIEIDAASHTGVDAMRQLQEDIMYSTPSFPGRPNLYAFLTRIEDWRDALQELGQSDEDQPRKRLKGFILLAARKYNGG